MLGSIFQGVSMTRLHRSFWAVLIVAFFSGMGAQADSLSFTTVDTSPGGITTQNPDGSFRLQTFSTADKASVKFYTLDGANLKVLGNLGGADGISGFSADLLKSSPADSVSELAIRLFTNASFTEGLVWENAYNGNGIVPVGGWQHLDITGGNFWERVKPTNFNGAGQAVTLGSWASGFTPSGGKTLGEGTPIYGIEVSFGSGSGAYDGSVGNVQLDFKNGASYIGAESPMAADAAATPLPSAALGGLACLGLFAAGRRRHAVGA
jgi:hypothetical protein